jgi:hypothetical protein
MYNQQNDFINLSYFFIMKNAKVLIHQIYQSFMYQFQILSLINYFTSGIKGAFFYLIFSQSTPLKKG